MTNSIYDKHDSAFNAISAYVIIYPNNNGVDFIAKVAFKRGKTGNVKCFLHQFGLPMVAGQAGGGGYDKLSAAFYDAASKNLKNMKADDKVKGTDDVCFFASCIFEAAKNGNGSSNWQNALTDKYLKVLQAV